MTFFRLSVLSAIFLLFSASAFAEMSAKTRALAEQSVSADADARQAAIAGLRAMHQDGVDALFEVYAKQIDQFSKTGEATPEWKQIASALDGVAMQKDAFAAHLYWFTDLAEAKSESARTGKPILSLRLLGNLNEEFSCANSRFFRGILYPSSSISNALRYKYVLHWQSVRPAPKVTIDFGDGRKIERTLTGNSIHYILNSDGTVIDALPGLYDQQDFDMFLMRGEYAFRQTQGLSPEARALLLQGLRKRAYDDLSDRMSRDFTAAGIKFDKTKEPARKFEAMPTAIEAAPRAITKMATELYIINGIQSDMAAYGADQINLDSWKLMIKPDILQYKLDDASVAFIKRQTAGNGLAEAQFAALIRNLETTIAIDAKRNDYLLRPSLYVWLNKGWDQDVDKLNERVYSELFLTPRADAWLGLYSPDIYTALEGNGIIK
jgi:hypothetical protein